MLLQFASAALQRRSDALQCPAAPEQVGFACACATKSSARIAATYTTMRVMRAGAANARARLEQHLLDA
jgi:hypothetical protein